MPYDMNAERRHRSAGHSRSLINEFTIYLKKCPLVGADWPGGGAGSVEGFWDSFG